MTDIQEVKKPTFVSWVIGLCGLIALGFALTAMFLMRDIDSEYVQLTTTIFLCEVSLFWVSRSDNWAERMTALMGVVLSLMLVSTPLMNVMSRFL